MFVRYGMKFASFRAGYRAVKAFAGAAICTSSIVITRSCPGVLRCCKATCSFPAPVAQCPIPARGLSTSASGSALSASLLKERGEGNHFANPMNKYLDHEENCAESLEEITREQKRRLSAIKRARAARYFVEEEEPEKRTLSWDTIEQIRYLRQEDPTEWSDAVLAKSFNVSRGVIAKVLKSKFTPSSKVRQKQDKAAAENSGCRKNAAESNALVHVHVAHRKPDTPAVHKQSSPQYPRYKPNIFEAVQSHRDNAMVKGFTQLKPVTHQNVGNINNKKRATGKATVS